MKDPLVYKEWIEAFRREVDEELTRMRAAPPRPESQAPRGPQEAAALREWWRARLEDPAAPAESWTTLQVDKELELSRREIGELKAELERSRSGSEAFPALQEQARALAEERARLEEQLRAARREGEMLRELKTNLEEQIGSLRLRLSAVRGEHEAKAKLLEEERDLQAQRLAATSMELKNERESRAAAESRLQELRARAIEAEALRAEVAALRGEIAAARPRPPEPPR